VTRTVRAPECRPASDPFDLIPGFGQHACGFEQHAKATERRIDLDREVRLDAKPFRAVAMSLLDAALGIAAIEAHVPVARGASRTEQRIGPPHDADNKIAARKIAALRSGLDGPQGFVAKNETRLVRRRPAIVAGDNLAIGATNAERVRAHQDLTVGYRRQRNVLKIDGIGPARQDCQCAHTEETSIGAMKFHRHRSPASVGRGLARSLWNRAYSMVGCQICGRDAATCAQASGWPPESRA